MKNNIIYLLFFNLIFIILNFIEHYYILEYMSYFNVYTIYYSIVVI